MIYRTATYGSAIVLDVVVNVREALILSEGWEVGVGKGFDTIIIILLGLD